MRHLEDLPRDRGSGITEHAHAVLVLVGERPVVMLAIDVASADPDRIDRIWAVVNPDKLAAVLHRGSDGAAEGAKPGPAKT
jgi:hypothetical protein